MALLISVHFLSVLPNQLCFKPSNTLRLLKGHQTGGVPTRLKMIIRSVDSLLKSGMRTAIIFFFLGVMAGIQGRAKDKLPLSTQFAEIEQQIGGRLGVAALDTGNGQRMEYRAAERFPICSTFKFLLAAAILRQGDQEPLDRQLRYGADDLLERAPITRKHLSEGEMTVRDLCAAAIEYSDNTAGNLLLGAIGGPSKLTEYLRGLGDPMTRLDRTEPSLNSAIAGDQRDTTTPGAMLSNLKLLLLDVGLSQDARSQLEAWLQASTTGTKRIRAALPSGWRVGDKTGTGENGAASDIAIVRPPERAPILIAIYLVGSASKLEQLDRAIARTASVIVQYFLANGWSRTGSHRVTRPRFPLPFPLCCHRSVQNRPVVIESKPTTFMVTRGI
jgi:beta-lactamase class A